MKINLRPFKNERRKTQAKGETRTRTSNKGSSLPLAFVDQSAQGVIMFLPLSILPYLPPRPLNNAAYCTVTSDLKMLPDSGQGVAGGTPNQVNGQVADHILAATSGVQQLLLPHLEVITDQSQDLFGRRGQLA